jgi:hypothetical protein
MIEGSGSIPEALSLTNGSGSRRPNNIRIRNSVINNERFILGPGQQQQQQEPEEPLPPGWEMRFDSYGRKYYVDHNTRYELLNLQMLRMS